MARLSAENEALLDEIEALRAMYLEVGVKGESEWGSGGGVRDAEASILQNESAPPRICIGSTLVPFCSGAAGQHRDEEHVGRAAMIATLSILQLGGGRSRCLARSQTAHSVMDFLLEI